MGRRDSYRFVDRSTSKKGKIAFGCSVLSLCIQLGLIYKAVERTATIIDGLIGIYSFLLSCIAIIFMIGSIREDGLYSKYQFITTILTIGVCVLHVFLFVLGVL